MKHRKRHKKRHYSPWLIFTLFIVLALAGDMYAISRQMELNGVFPQAVASTPDPEITSSPLPSPSAPISTPTPSSLPDHASVTVPFLVQAPFAKWDALHEDACEETSLIMVNHFLNATTIESATSGDKEINDLVNYEAGKGYGLSITLLELKDIAVDYYSLKGREVINPTLTDIKQELANGNPVIIPAAGKLLANPHFSNGGPNYHMMVLTGYDSQGFITNDPGIKEGEHYRYPFDTLYNAIHDWDAGNILNGQKAYLVLEK